MENELTEKAVKMLLKGGTMVSEPCPYCSGVRIMQDGHAFCVNCGKEPKLENDEKLNSIKKEKENQKNLQEKGIEDLQLSKESKITKSLDLDPSKSILQKKLEKLSQDLESEPDYYKQQKILKSINSLVEVLKKFEK